MKFQQYPVSKALQSHVAHYWTLQSEEGEKAGANYRFIPDGSVDWVFHLADPWTYSFPVANQLQKQFRSHLIGQFKNYMDLSLPCGDFFLFGISFHPWAARDIWQIDMSEVTDNSIALADLDIPQLNFLEEAIHAAEDMPTRINQVESFLMSRLPDCGSTLLKEVVLALSQNTNTLAYADFPISKRRLEQRFKLEIGLSPKLFQRTSRVNKIIKRLIHQPEIKLTELAYEFNFYDQSHFIADFKQFTGCSPSRFLKSIKPSGPIYNFQVEG